MTSLKKSHRNCWCLLPEVSNNVQQSTNNDYSKHFVYNEATNYLSFLSVSRLYLFLATRVHCKNIYSCYKLLQCFIFFFKIGNFVTRNRNLMVVIGNWKIDKSSSLSFLYTVKNKFSKLQVLIMLAVVKFWAINNYICGVIIN